MNFEIGHGIQISVIAFELITLLRLFITINGSFDIGIRIELILYFELWQLDAF